jgi:hypothetical protein
MQGKSSALYVVLLFFSRDFFLKKCAIHFSFCLEK